VGPASYDPNYDILHKNAPNITSVSKKLSARPVPKKALENFISTIFSSPVREELIQHSTTEELSRDISKSSLNNKHLRLGKAMF
jgi:hypothetical protein